MKIFIEGYNYNVSLVKKYLYDIDELDVERDLLSMNYIGYFFNNEINDCVFILPKVLIDNEDKVFGKYAPEDIVDLDNQKLLSDDEYRFICEFAVLVYRTINVFKNNKKDTSIVCQRDLVKIGKGRKHVYNTYLDVILALIQFYKENQDFFMFILKNIHSGFNKINWLRTISQSKAIVQDDEPIYINPVNKKRQINFDEELLVIFFSILKYISDKYGFTISINYNYDIIQGKRFEHYINGFGVIRLLQIKYKYFSDKTLALWKLCYAFFDHSHKMKVNSSQNEYLLVKNFNIVFEAIIDELVGDKQLPDRLNKKQDDGKIVDHLFMWGSLTSADTSKKMYYIGDSKYYKIGNKITDESVAKQHTYARNVIQWNLDLYAKGQYTRDDYKLRDEITEGYNIIPNFFVSAKIVKKDDKLSYDDIVDKTDRSDKIYFRRHFDNRLFDRDSLIVSHYDVNFLFVLSLYARDNAGQKSIWKKKVRNKIRSEIQMWLQQSYKFYIIQPKCKNLKDVVDKHFRILNGKIYKPSDSEDRVILALDKKFQHENTSLMTQIKEDFDIYDYRLDTL